jgi:hypothetical protein
MPDSVSRRAAAGIGATALVVLLIAGATVVDRRGGEPDVTVVAGGGDRDGTLAAASDRPDLAPAPTTTTVPPPPPPPPSTTTTAVPRTSTTKAATTTASTPPKSRQSYTGGFEPRVPGGVRHPYVAGQTVWSATSNGMAMTIRIDTANPAAGAPVRVVMEVTPPPGVICCFVDLVRTDGVRFGTQTTKSDSTACATLVSSPQRVETTVTFNQAGRVEFAYQTSPTCLVPGPGIYGVIYGFIEVAPGRTTSQGPFVPVLQVNHAGLFPEPTDSLVKGVHAFARDEDGYIAGFSLNWGDGTPVETYSGDPLGCMQLPGGWTNASQTMMSSTKADRTPPTHRYAQAGTYTVTVHVWSTGCDGADEQKVSGTLNVSLT